MGVSLGASTLSVGQNTQAYATLMDSAGRSVTVTGDTVTWASSNSAVASVGLATGTVTALAFSPDGETLASGGLDGLIKFWPTTKK